MIKPSYRTPLSWLFILFSICLQVSAAEKTADESLKLLNEGTARYRSDRLEHPNLTPNRREEVASGQHPFVTVLTCSDSRVPVELIFDRGLGDLFVVRVAGNVAKTDEIGSVEYGVEHLETPLLVVLGHSSCGAVKAVVEKAHVGGSIPDLVSGIVPVVEQVKKENASAPVAELLGKAIEANMWHSIATLLTQSDIVSERVRAGKLKVVGALYDLKTGEITWKGEHPEQARLIARQSEEASPSSEATHAAPASEQAKATTGNEAPPSSIGVVGYAITAGCTLALIAALVLFEKHQMRNWPVGRRLTLGFSVLGLLLAGLVVLAYEGLTSANQGFTSYRLDARHSVLAGRIQANFLEMRIVAKDFFVTKSSKDVQAYEARRDKLLGFMKEAEAAFDHEPAREEAVRTIRTALTEHIKNFEAYVAATHAGTPEETLKAIAGKMTTVGETLDHAVEELKLGIINDQNRDGPIIAARMLHTRSLVVSIACGTLVTAVLLSLLIQRSIVLPLKSVTEVVAEGADQIASAARQVAGSAQILAEGSSEQAASLEETSASLEEMTSMTKRNADSALNAKAVASRTRQAADKGAVDMNEMRAAMEAIGASSADIAKIVKTIDEIAFQTNLLALNAAVEAARAGESGAGFAVVADEVRALAQRSAEAAKESSAKIEDSVAKGRNGALICEQVGGSLQHIVSGAREMDHIVGEIASASSEQGQGIGQINAAISQMDKVMQANASSSEESAAAAHEMQRQASALQEALKDLHRLSGKA